MVEKKMLFFNCPVCKKPVVLNVETSDFQELRRIAIKHFDHILLIEYDMYATLRTLTTFKSVNINEGRKIICPKCQRVEYIPILTEELDRYAFDHGDHALLVYVIFGRIAYDIVDIIRIGKPTLPVKNIIRDIVEKVGSEYLASMLTEIIISGPKIIYADEEIFHKINELFNRIRILRRIQIIRGKYKIKEDLPLAYFKTVIEDIKNDPEYEALDKLNKQLDFVEKLIGTLEKSFKENPFRAKQILDSIKEEPLKAILRRALEEKYSITL